jgi:WD repeat-containing protein 19
MAASAKKILEFGPEVNGYSPVIFQWSSDSNYIAVATENRLLYLLDRRGKKIQETLLPNKGKVLMIDWDKESEYVGVLQEDSSQVYLWAALTTNQLETIEDTPKTKATWIKWSHTHPILAFGTDKGGVIFYNKKNKKKVPTMGKHSKKVITGDWNNEGMLSNFLIKHSHW